jgi:chorismate mutase
MDRLNGRIVALLQARARLARESGRAKARSGRDAADPVRERAMLRAALSGAPEGFPRRDLERLLLAVFAASRRLVVADRRARQVSARSRRRRAP